MFVKKKFVEMKKKRRLTLVSPSIIQVIQYRDQNIQHITALQDEKQELL